MKRYILHAYNAHRCLHERPLSVITFVACLLHIMLLLQIFLMLQVCRFKLADNLFLHRRGLYSSIPYYFTLYYLLCDPLTLRLVPRWNFAIGCHLVVRTWPSEGLISELLPSSLAPEGKVGEREHQALEHAEAETELHKHRISPGCRRLGSFHCWSCLVAWLGSWVQMTPWGSKDRWR